MEQSLQWNTAGDWPHLLGKYSNTMVAQLPRPCCKYAIQQIAPSPWWADEPTFWQTKLDQSKMVSLKLSRAVAPFKRLVICRDTWLCNIKAKLPSKGLCLWPPREPHLRNPALGYNWPNKITLGQGSSTRNPWASGHLLGPHDCRLVLNTINMISVFKLLLANMLIFINDD